MRLTWILAVVLAAGAVAQTPEAMMGAALHQERVTGNLQAAIDGYRKVLAAKGVTRTVAAQAQYHIGICFEKLGDQEARRAFESVVKNYGDQGNFVSQARARLAAMAGGKQLAGGQRTRVVWDDASDTWGTVSSDGRLFSFVDWSTCDLAMRDLETGQNRRLTNYGGCEKAAGEAEGSAMSPDGKRVVYAYRAFSGGKTKRADIAVVGTDGKGQRVLLTGNGLDYSEPSSWSADGKWVAASVKHRGEKAEDDGIVILGVDSGEVKRFAVKDKQWAYHPGFSPDGKWLAYTVGGSRGNPLLLITRPTDDVKIPETIVAEEALMMGWTADGNLLFTRKKETSRLLMHLPMAGGKSTGEATPLYTSANIGYASGGITKLGSLLYKTANRHIETRVLPWSSEGRFDGKPIARLSATSSVDWLLGPGIAHFSNDGKRIFSESENNALLIRELSSGVERIVHPELKSWRAARWKHDDSALLVMGVGNDGKAGIFEVDIPTAKPTLLMEVREDNWSFTNSRDGKTIFYGKPAETRARDLATGEDKVIFGPAIGGNYDLRASRDGQLLAIRSSKALVIIDLKSGQSRELYRIPSDQQMGWVFWGMEWSPNDSELIAIVRPGAVRDNMECWTLPVAGGEPKRQSIDIGWRGISFSPDGKYVVSTNTTELRQLWAIENFLPAKK